MALPKLSAQQRIVNPDGTPSSPFLQFMEKARTDQESIDARQDATDAALVLVNERQDDTDALLAAAITDIATAVGLATAATAAVAGLADGTTAFTGLNVGGTDVKPFLDKTDGTKLTDSTGLGTSVVETAAIVTAAITTSDVDFTAASVDCKTTSNVTLASVTITTTATDRIDLIGNSSARAKGDDSVSFTGDLAQQPEVAIFRDGTEITASRRNAPSIIFGVDVGTSVMTAISDAPGAGTFTYTYQSILSSTTNVDVYNHSKRYLLATRAKR